MSYLTEKLNVTVAGLRGPGLSATDRADFEGYRDVALSAAVTAETSANFAEEFSGPAYATIAAGEAATSVGQFFRVPIAGTSPVEYKRYQRTAAGSVEAAPLATTAELRKSAGSKMVGYRGYTAADYLDAGVFQNNRLAMLRSACAIGRTYIRKGVVANSGPGSRFSVGMNMNGQNSAEWAFEADADDFWRIQYAYTGRIRPSAVTADATNFSGTYQSASNPYFRSTEIGNSFEIPFNGVGFTFQSYAEERGGIFGVEVDGVNLGTVSCWAPGAGVSIRQTTFGGFSAGAHVAKFTFLGADPEHAPATGGPRGYFKLSSVSAGVATAIVISGNEMALSNSGLTLTATKILECPIGAAPVGSGWAPDWVPVHGSKVGAMVVTKRELFLDGKILSSLDLLPTDEIAFSEFSLRQEITAYNTSDTGKTIPMWKGVFTHKMNRDGLSISYKFKTLVNLNISSAYSGDIATKISTFGVAEIDNGFSKDCAVPASGTTTTYVGPCRSAVFYSRVSPIALAVSLDSFVSATSMGSVVGEAPASSVLLTERSDDVQKIYWLLFKDGAIVPAGTEVRHEHTYFLASNHAYGL